MKRHFFVMFFFTAIGITANAEWNNKISIGASPFTVWQSDDSKDSGKDYLGFNIHNLLRPNYLPLGIFTGLAFSFSQEFNNTSNLITIDKGFSIEEVLGADFYIEFNDILSVQLAAGLHLKESFLQGSTNEIQYAGNGVDDEGHSVTNYDNNKTKNTYFEFAIGLGLILQFDILISDTVFLNVGSSFLFDFATPISNKALTIRPFIGVGFEYDTDDLFVINVPD